MALLKANTGIGITNPSSALHVIGDGLFVGIVSATTFYGNLGGGVQGSVPYQSAVNTTTFLSPGTSGQVLVTAGSGQNPFWSSLAGSFTGITIKDEGSIVGSAASISSLNFVGSNIVATASGAGATITLSNDAQYLTGTAPGSVISQSSGLTVTGNVSISGNISVGGTSAILNADTLQVKDKDIVLGITTNALNQDVSTDFTANHGGIAIASTEGSPLIDIVAGVGTGSIPYTYKQIMWLKSGSWTGLGTDAWLFNYGVGIGSTQFPNGTRLAVGSVKFTENDLVSVRNINASGVITATQFVGSFSGNVTTADYATSAGIATYATSAGIATYATSAGIATYATSAGIATYATSAGIATYATSAGIATYATSAGIATYATNAGIATYATSAGIATYATSAGIATYATSAGIATYATSAGIATYATSAGIATYATNAGIATYATSAGIATYATSAGIATNVIGGIASITSLSVSGISTLGTVQISSGIVTATVGVVTYYGDGSKLTGISAGIATYATSAGIATYATSAGIATYATSAGIATYATSAGIATYATSAGIATNVIGGIASITSLSVSGISTLGTVQISSGIVTATTGIVTYYGDGSKLTGISAGIATYATSAGIATYATSAGIATNVIGGIASITSLSVSGISTLGTVQISSGIVTATTGIVTYYGDGSKLTGISASGGISSVSISTNTTNQSQYLTYVTGTGNTTGLNVSTGLVFNPSTGNLGIGTTNPKAKLYSYGTVGVGETEVLGFPVNTLIEVEDTNPWTIAFRRTDLGPKYDVAAFTSNDGSFYFASGDGVTNSYYRNIGISTNNFQVFTNDFTPMGTSIYPNDSISFRVDSNANSLVYNNLLVGIQTLTGTPNQRLQVTGGAYVSGSVGIGTTNPSQILHIQGNARVTGAVYDSTNSPGTSGQVLQSTITGTQWATASASGVGIRSDGTTIVGSGATILDFTGPGIATVTSSGGIATITVASEDVFIVPLSDETSNIGIGTSVIAFRAPFPMRIVSIPRANVSTAATQGRVVVDVKVAGTTILGANKIGIDTNATTSTTAAVQTTLAANPTTIADDALMTFDITGIGTGAKGLKVNLYYYKNSN